jgi:hypothetical protein
MGFEEVKHLISFDSETTFTNKHSVPTVRRIHPGKNRRLGQKPSADCRSALRRKIWGDSRGLLCQWCAMGARGIGLKVTSLDMIIRFHNSCSLCVPDSLLAEAENTLAPPQRLTFSSGSKPSRSTQAAERRHFRCALSNPPVCARNDIVAWPSV